MQRYFADIIKDKVQLSKDDVHHLTNVMRVRQNEIIEIVSNSRVFEATVTSLKPLTIVVNKEIDEDNELCNEVILIVSLLKGEKMDLVLQKATEIGVSKIFLLSAERSIVKISKQDKENKIARFNKILKEASQQSKRRIIPVIDDLITIHELNKVNADIKMIAYEENKGKTSSFYNQLSQIDKRSSIAVLVGPEGGFTSKEVEKANEFGYINISLGKRILRAETACLYALSVISSYLEK